MCVPKKKWGQINDSPAYKVANQFAHELKNYANSIGKDSNNIRIRNKEQITREGFSKADSQVIWNDGPEDWALDFPYSDTEEVSYIAENGQTISFYIK